MADDREKLHELIEDIRVGMVTTVEPDGTLHTRPLATIQYDEEGYVWFFISSDSAKVEELAQDVRVSVAYSHPGKEEYVALAGVGFVLRDREKIRELWTPFAKAWFPDGPDDPKLALLRVRVDRAEYWTAPGRAAYVLGLAKAVVTGRPPGLGKDRKLTM